MRLDESQETLNPEGHWIQLRSGAPYTYGQPGPVEGFDPWEDLVYPLAHMPRYLAHTQEPWSVAAHLNACAVLLANHKYSDEIVGFAHRHDNAEALVGDCPAPLKRLLGETFNQYERSAEAALARTCGYILPIMPAELTAVKMADLALLEAERRVLKSNVKKAWNTPYDADMVEEAVDIVKTSLRWGLNWGAPAMEEYNRQWEMYGGKHALRSAL